MANNLGPRLPLPMKVNNGTYFTVVYENKPFPQAKSQTDLIVSSIRNILMTRTGERPMSDFGSDVQLLAFEQNDPDLALLGSDMIREAITQWEPRVNIISITVTQVGDSAAWNIQLQEIADPSNIIPLTVTQ